MNSLLQVPTVQHNVTYTDSNYYCNGIVMVLFKLLSGDCSEYDQDNYTANVNLSEM